MVRWGRNGRIIFLWVPATYTVCLFRPISLFHKKISGVKKWESNGFIRVDILDLIKELLIKVAERKNETHTTLLEFLEGCLCRMDDTISWKDV